MAIKEEQRTVTARVRPEYFKPLMKALEKERVKRKQKSRSATIEIILLEHFKL